MFWGEFIVVEEPGITWFQYIRQKKLCRKWGPKYLQNTHWLYRSKARHTYGNPLISGTIIEHLIFKKEVLNITTIRAHFIPGTQKTIWRLEPSCDLATYEESVWSHRVRHNWSDTTAAAAEESSVDWLSLERTQNATKSRLAPQTFQVINIEIVDFLAPEGYGLSSTFLFI